MENLKTDVFIFAWKRYDYLDTSVHIYKSNESSKIFDDNYFMQASIAVVTREFHDILVGSSGDTATNVMLRNISWSGLR